MGKTVEINEIRGVVLLERHFYVHKNFTIINDNLFEIIKRIFYYAGKQFYTFGWLKVLF